MLAATLSAQTPPSLMENLGRGVVAVRSSSNEIFVSWRFLGTDPEDTAFNLYRVADSGAPVKLNASPITGATNFQDTTFAAAQTNAYYVRPIFYGIEGDPSASFTVPASAPVQQYLRLPLNRPAGGVTPAGESYTYEPNDLSTGDLDGDGEYEIIVKWYPSNAKDNSQGGYTGNVYLDAYKLNSTGDYLWRIDLGKNIRAGAHYTQFMVYDFDGDGIAEIACKTADGTVDGVGTVIGDPTADYRTTKDTEFGGLEGLIVQGPEFLTVFNGQTGAAMDTVKYLPTRNPDTGSDTVTPAEMNTLWGGDNYGNRIERYLACVAYLDGRRPSLVMCRGYYARTVLAAWDFRDGHLVQRWIFDSGVPGAGKDGKPNSAYAAQGNHNLTVADVDGDGKDEIIYGSCAIDDDGQGLYSTGLGHGDAMHVSDMIPSRPGLEVWVCHENAPYGHSLRDARTGEVLLRLTATGDTGRAGAGHIDSRYPGYQVWGSAANVIDATTKVQISTNRPAMNFMIWWDGDLQRELLDGTTITKWNGSSASSHFAPSGVGSGNGTKANPGLSGDILGDWREELIVRETGNDALRIYTTTAFTTHRIRTLMHDRQYRLAIAWQNVAYNQPPHTSYYIGAGMETPPRPNIVTSLSELLGPAAPVFTGITPDTGVSDTDGITSATSIFLHGAAAPGSTVTLVRLGDGQIGTTVADATTGEWTFDYTGTPLAEGVHRFAATASDATYTGVQSDPYVVTVITTPSGPPSIAGVSKDATVLTIAGSGPVGGRVTVRIDSSPVGTADVDADGVWEFDYNDTLPATLHDFIAEAVDVAGNPSTATSPTTAIDTGITTPLITAVTPDTGTSGDFITNANTITLHGSAGNDNPVTVSLAGAGVIGTPVADATGVWMLSYPATGTLPDGEYVFSAATTLSVNTSPSSPPVMVKIDTTAPTVASVARYNPATEQTSANVFVFKVTFSEPVLGLQDSSFSPQFSGGNLAGSLTGWQVSPDDARVVLVTITAQGTTEGTLRLDINAAGLFDSADNIMAANYTTGETYTRTLRGDGVWFNSAGGQWGEFGNWVNDVMAEGAAKSADFSTLDLQDDITVRLDASRTITNITFGDVDPETGGNWLIAPGAGTLTLATGLSAPIITVNELAPGATAGIAAPLAGTVGFSKSGDGTLVLSGSSPLSGAIVINAGTLAVTTGGYYGSLGALTVQTEKTFILDGGYARPASIALTGAVPRLTVKSGTLNSTGALTADKDGNGFAVRFEGGLVSLASIAIQRSTDGNVTNFDRGIVIAGGTTTVSGSVALGIGASNALMSVEGGQLTVGGVITIANLNTNSARGGAFRVTGGRFVSTNTTSGIVMNARTGASAGNVSYLHFLGGVSQVEKITLGASASVTSGTTFVNVNGGTLFLGSGGIVKSGGAALVTSVNLTSGVLGAKANWSSSVPMTLLAEADKPHVALHAADESGVARTITLSGALTGDGGLTKTGGGVVTLSANNSNFSGAVTVAGGTLALTGNNIATGPVAVNEGVLNVTGNTIATGSVTVNEGVLNINGSGITTGPVAVAGGTLTINGSLAASASAVTIADGATLTGAGAINRPVTLQPGAILALSTSSPLTIPDNALTKTGGGQVLLSLIGGLPAAGTYTLATFGSTNLANADFAPIMTPTMRGTVQVYSTKIELLVADIDTALNTDLADADAFVAAIAASIGDGHGQYPQAALTALKAAIYDIRVGMGQPGFSAAAAIAALQDVLDDFTDEQIAVDFDDLDATLDDAAALHAGADVGAGDGQYQQAALDTFADAIDTVKSVRGKPAVTQDEIATALTALQNAMEAFESAVISVDFRALTTAITDANALHSTALAVGAGDGHGQHSQTDITALADAINVAQTVAETPAVTQTEVDTALGALQGVITAFTSAIIDVDFSALDAEIAAAATLLATVTADAGNIGNGHGQYPQPAIDTFAAALATAQAASGQLGLTPTQVASELGTLQPAAAAFAAARVIVNFSALETAIATAAALRTQANAGEGHGQHAQAAIDALADAIDAALTAAAAPAPTQTAINDARDTLQLAIDAFESAVQNVNFSALTAAITGADTLLATATIGAAAGEYPQSAADAFAAVIGTVKAVAGKLGVTQTEADTARRMLETAMSDFEAAQITAADVAAPRITRHPVAQTVRPGATASFTAAATGPGLHYQWQKDGVDIASATTDALFIINAKSADAGVYRVIVTNDHGETTSNEARLTLEEPPSDGGGAPTWWLLALSTALLTLRAVIRRRK
jgi:rhamnogalacturonan endolyase